MASDGRAWWRRGGTSVAVAGVVAAGLLTGAAAVARPDRSSRPEGRADCAAAQAAEATTVYTDHRFGDADLPGVGAYPSMSWQVRTLGAPCSRVPGPTDRQYQGLLRLDPADARALAARHRWLPADPAAALPVWPGLAAQVPADVRWRHSPEYDRAASTTREVQFRFDVDHRLVLFVLQDR